MIGRRVLLGGVGSALLMPRLVSAATTGASSLDPLDTMVRLRSSTDGQYTIGWLDAVREIMIDGEIIPFCRMLACGFSSFVKRGDVYDARVFEVAYYCAPGTNEPLGSYTFPGSDGAVEIPDYRVGPETVQFGRNIDYWMDYGATGDEEPNEDFAPPGQVRLQRSVEDPIFDQGTAIVRANEYGRVYPEPDAEPAVFYREWLIWKGSAAALLETEEPNVPAEMDYNAVSSYRPYMQLDNSRGHTIENGFGRKAATMDEIPEDILELVAERDPDVLEGPKKILEG